MGTILPRAAAVNLMIYKQTIKEKFNFSLLVGDIAYANLGDSKEIEPLWDLYA